MARNSYYDRREYTPSLEDHGTSFAIVMAPLLRRRRLEDIAIFRRYLSNSVRQASPLLLGMAGLDVDLGWAMRMMRPPERRRSFHAGHRPGKSRRPEWWEDGARGFERRHSRFGLVLRRFEDPSGRLGIVLEEGCLNCEVALGSGVVRTGGADAELWLPQALPETIMLGMAGRPVSDLVENGFLRDPAYVVDSCYRVGRGTLLRFTAEPVPFTVSF